MRYSRPCHHTHFLVSQKQQIHHRIIHLIDATWMGERSSPAPCYPGTIPQCTLRRRNSYRTMQSYQGHLCATTSLARVGSLPTSYPLYSLLYAASHPSHGQITTLFPVDLPTFQVRWRLSPSQHTTSGSDPARPSPLVLCDEPRAMTPERRSTNPQASQASPLGALASVLRSHFPSNQHNPRSSPVHLATYYL